MLSAEAFVGPCAKRTQQVWRPILYNLDHQTCCEGPGEAWAVKKLGLQGDSASATFVS